MRFSNTNVFKEKKNINNVLSKAQQKAQLALVNESENETQLKGNIKMHKENKQLLEKKKKKPKPIEIKSNFVFASVFLGLHFLVVISQCFSQVFCIWQMTKGKTIEEKTCNKIAKLFFGL